MPSPARARSASRPRRAARPRWCCSSATRCWSRAWRRRASAWARRRVRIERADALQWMARAPAARSTSSSSIRRSIRRCSRRRSAPAARIVGAGGFVYAEGPTPVEPRQPRSAGLEPWRAGRAGAVHFELLRKVQRGGLNSRGYTAPHRESRGAERRCRLAAWRPTVTSVTRLTAVYPGTFDPMTLGHEDLMRRASRLFERLLVAVAAGHHKRTMFSVAERLEIATELASKYPNVEVMAFRGLLRDFVVEQGGKRRRARPARGERLRVRVPDGRHEPPAACPTSRPCS